MTLCEQIMGNLTYSQALALSISELTQIRVEQQKLCAMQLYPSEAENIARAEFGLLENVIQKNALFWLWGLTGAGAEWDRSRK